jgi:hypothetical protein
VAPCPNHPVRRGVSDALLIVDNVVSLDGYDVNEACLRLTPQSRRSEAGRR